MANREGGLQMDSIWISDSLMIAKIQWIVFGYQKDNKEDRLQMDSIWIFDTCLEGYSGYNGHFWTFLDTKGKMDFSNTYLECSPRCNG